MIGGAQVGLRDEEVSARQVEMEIEVLIAGGIAGLRCEIGSRCLTGMGGSGLLGGGYCSTKDDFFLIVRGFGIKSTELLDRLWPPRRSILNIWVDVLGFQNRCSREVSSSFQIKIVGSGAGKACSSVNGVTGVFKPLAAPDSRSSWSKILETSDSTGESEALECWSIVPAWVSM